ncbi:MAG: hypothetical protein K0S33_3117 [Bacteroidetes bacterium]|jgi:hypothetical protein|nr:hypothetical protein [Bacteroidota bacterium]
MQPKKRIWKKHYWLILCSAITLAGVFIFTVYGQGYKRDTIRFLSFLMVLSLPFCLYILYFQFNSKRWYAKIVDTFVMVVYVAPFFGGLVLVHNYYEEFHLKNYPATVFAKKTGTESERTRHGNVYHYSTFEYSYGSSIYKLRLSDGNSNYKMGDSIKLEISYRNPEVYKVEEK